MVSEANVLKDALIYLKTNNLELLTSTSLNSVKELASFLNESEINSYIDLLMECNKEFKISNNPLFTFEIYLLKLSSLNNSKPEITKKEVVKEVINIQPQKEIIEENYDTKTFVLTNDIGFYEKNPIYNSDGTVTFFYSNNTAKEVMFTSDKLGFDSLRYPMTYSNNLWFITLRPESGNYYYNFVVDRIWEVDPLNMNVYKGSDGRLHSYILINYNQTNTIKY